MVGTIGKVGTVAGNGTNGTAVVTNAGNFNIGGVVAASSLLITGAVETASVVANKNSLAEMIGKSDAKAIGKLNTVAAGVLAAMDAKNLYDTYTNTGEVNLKDALSFAGNVLAVGAGIAMMSNPFGLAVGAFALASVAFAGASIATDKDTDLINHGAERGQEFGRRVEDALTNIKEKANDITLGKPIQDFFDNQVQDAVDNMLKNKEKLGELVDKIKEEVVKSENHSPTDLLEKLLTPIMKFGIGLSEKGDELSKEMEDLAEKIKDTLKDILDKIADLNLPNPFDDLPDDLAEAFAKWAGINRSGFHYFYDPIVLDLDGDGVITIQRALFNHNNISILAINEEERWAA